MNTENKVIFGLLILLFMAFAFIIGSAVGHYSRNEELSNLRSKLKECRSGNEKENFIIGKNDDPFLNSSSDPFLKGKPHDNAPSIINEMGHKDEQLSYTLEYNRMKQSFLGKSQTSYARGRIVLLPDEIQIFKGKTGERFIIQEVQKSSNKLIISGINNRGERAIFKIRSQNNKTIVETDMNGVLFDFNVTIGNFSEIKLYDDSVNEIDSEEIGEIQVQPDCNCPKINRSDGTNLIICTPQPVGYTKSNQVGLGLGYNGKDCFITMIVRFSGESIKLRSDLGILFSDNSLISFSLINSQQSFIEGSHTSNSIFKINNAHFDKIRGSTIQTVSFTLADGIVYTIEASSNNDILMKNANCLHLEPENLLHQI